MKTGEKLKKHFRDNKKVYIAVGITAAVVGTGAYILYANHKASCGVAQQMVHDISAGGDVQIAGRDVVNVVEGLAKRGHAGNVVRCIETGEIFASQNRAASLFGGDSITMSQHLNGVLENFKGFHFERLGEFPT